MKKEKPRVDTYVCTTVANNYCNLAMVINGETSYLTFRVSDAANEKRLKTTEVMKTLVTDNLRV